MDEIKEILKVMLHNEEMRIADLRDFRNEMREFREEMRQQFSQVNGRLERIGTIRE